MGVTQSVESLNLWRPVLEGLAMGAAIGLRNEFAMEVFKKGASYQVAMIATRPLTTPRPRPTSYYSTVSGGRAGARGGERWVHVNEPWFST